MAGNLTAMIASIFSGSAVTADPYFEYTTLLLPGSGTNGAQNNTFLDSSTNNFTITRNGNTTQGTFSPFSQTGWGNYFNGTNAYLSTPSITIGSGDFTIEGWQYILPDGTDYGRVVGIGDFQTSSGLGINFNPSTLKFEITTGNSTIITSSGTFSYNIWYHISLVRSGNTVTLYVNGTSQGSVVNTNSISGVVYISAINYLSTIYYGASYTSNVRITTTAIVPPAGGPTAPLTAVTGTLLLTCQSNRFIDTNTQAAAKTITVNGSPSVVAFSPFNPTASWSAATVGGSGYFDGSGDYLTVANNAAFNFGTGDFTVEFWFYALAPAANSRFLSNAAYNASGIDISWESGSTRIAWYISSTPYVIPLPDRYAWHHVAFTRSGTTLNTYINGARANTYTNSSNITSANALGIGAESGGTNVTNSYISNLRLVKGTALYTGATYTVPTAPLTAITNTSLLLNFTNAGVYDATSKNDLETVGNAQISTIQSKWGGSSMSFDGTGDWLLIPDQPPQRIGTGKFTVELWVYRNSSGTYGLVGKGSSTTGWLVSLNSSNQVVFTYGSSTITSTGTVSSTTWTHIAVVREGTSTNQTKIYINGTNDGTGTVSTDFNQTNSMYIGADRTGGSAANAYVQDVRITNDARYTTNFTAPTAAFPTL